MTALASGLLALCVGADQTFAGGINMMQRATAPGRKAGRKQITRFIERTRTVPWVVGAANAGEKARRYAGPRASSAQHEVLGGAFVLGAQNAAQGLLGALNEMLDAPRNLHAPVSPASRIFGAQVVGATVRQHLVSGDGRLAGVRLVARLGMPSPYSTTSVHRTIDVAIIAPLAARILSKKALRELTKGADRTVVHATALQDLENWGEGIWYAHHDRQRDLSN